MKRYQDMYYGLVINDWYAQIQLVAFFCNFFETACSNK